MRFRINFLVAALAVGGATLACVGVTASAQANSSQAGNESTGRRQGRGSFPFGGRGVLGTVTEVAADHYTIKTDSGETLTVYYSVNTRIMKQGPGRGQGQARRGQNTDAEAADGPRTPPQPLKPADIKVGDIITAGGEEDTAKKSIGAIFIAQIDPERARQMREMQANYGKTWLAGRITGIEGTTITIDGMIDHAKHSIEVDENTSFRQRRDSITLADIKPGEQLRAEGSLKGGIFLATTVTASEARNRGQAPDGNPASPAIPQPE